MSLMDFMGYMPEWLHEELAKDANCLTEIRMRAGRQVQLVGCGINRFVGERMEAPELRRIALLMMDHSYYSREEELANGFFTLKNGFRVGVCGSYAERRDGIRTLVNMSSLCIRIAREVIGCAKSIVEDMIQQNDPQSFLILSRPGMGKTTILRDAARMLSEFGWAVGIADERHEIAACRDGIPTLDVGPRTDVIDGLAKKTAIEHLIRTMAPQVVVTDEIGNEQDADCLREAARRGVSIAASAHASSIDAFERSAAGKLLGEKLFHKVIFLDGEPGRIVEIRRYC